ncbi:ThuA domain-containing protein [candidate division KSB1 bacterium]|nr:ThuA domain-containing protein [candidate division KSB1 bacterium]RQW00136.1 MAG: ThuA domain-containing protein [candidate division KSB1 bacterium]
MKIEKTRLVLFITACAIMLLCHHAKADISAEDQTKIAQAIPQKTIVQPLQPRKILLMNLHVRDGKPSYGHDSTPCGNLALKLMGEQTDAFDVTFSNDTLMFKKENLEQFDAICFLNTAGVLFHDPTLRMNLLDFVSEGGGFIGIHAAAATFVQWPEYWQFPAFGQMLGAYEDGGHPWKPDETITLKVEEPNHPLTFMFKDQNFQIQDEVFQFRAPYSRDNLRILLSIDIEKTDMNPARRFLPERYADKDFAMSWIREYGKGRVFYTSLGHNSFIYWNPSVLEHILAGIQYALGDLKADATPSNQLKIKK